MSTPAAPLNFRQVLATPGVRRLWLAQIVSVFGDFLALFAVYSLVTFRMHGTATQVSLILISYMAPFAAIGPLAGAFVDRWNPKIAMIASDVIRAALAVMLVFGRNVNEYYLVFVALSAVSTFFIPAQSIVLRTIVPEGGLMSANALMSQAIQVMQIVSPAVAGGLAAWLGPESCFWIDSVSFLFSAVMVLGIAVEVKPVTGPASIRSIAAAVADGMKFIFTHRAVSFVIVAMTSGMFAIRCFSALLSVYVRDILLSNSALFGLLSSLVGIGMICATQGIRFAGSRWPKTHLVIGGLTVMGAGVLELVLTGNAVGAAAGMLVIGAGAAFIMIPSSTLLQEETPRPMLGRVSSSLWSVLSTAQIVAMVGAGPVAQKFGIRALYFASGAVLLVIGAAGATQLRQTREAPVAKAAD